MSNCQISLERDARVTGFNDRDAWIFFIAAGDFFFLIGKKGDDIIIIVEVKQTPDTHLEEVVPLCKGNNNTDKGIFLALHQRDTR